MQEEEQLLKTKDLNDLKMKQLALKSIKRIRRHYQTIYIVPSSFEIMKHFKLFQVSLWAIRF